MTLSNKPIPTVELSDTSNFSPKADALYVYGVRSEDRTHHLSSWQKTAKNLTPIELVEDGPDAVYCKSNPSEKTSLRDVGELKRLLGTDTTRPLYLDITGLSNHVWPAILKVAQERGFKVQVLYVEPRNYAYSATPRENVFFDLSELIKGIAPIPQFSNLSEPDEDSVSLIPLLGFEGARFRHLLEEVQPRSGGIFPVVGVPGFRAEYPFFAYQGNQLPLKESDAWQDVRLAKANCPFSLFYCLQGIRSDHDSDWFFKIGLIGTKPHALGAVMFALHHGSSVELVYDHTLRKPNRSAGKSTCLIYPITEFLDSLKLA